MSLSDNKMLALAKKLNKEGRLSEVDLAVLVETLVSQPKKFEELLIKTGAVSEAEFLEMKAKDAGLSTICLAQYKPDNKVLSKISADQAWLWQVIPLFEQQGKLTIATADPYDIGVFDRIKREASAKLVTMVASRREIEEALKTHYGKQQTKNVGQAETANVKPTAQSGDLDNATDILHKLVERAYKESASDIHLEPTEKNLLVRMRIDGILELVETLSVDMKQTLLSRLKIVGGMNVAEHRSTQDGRANIKIGDKPLDLRIAIYPTLFGEAAAIRLLSGSNIATLADIGMLEEQRLQLEKIIHKPNGIFLVTGPTGSGKTTTLYAALLAIDRKQNHVLSIEDPIENQIEGVGQTEINVKAGVTFPSALKAILRQDPDVIMVGEIRDQETADIACRASMTGHLVISTLHTNTALGAIMRLLDLDVERFILSSTLIGVLSQRLVRKLCEKCRVPVKLSADILKQLGVDDENMQAYEPKGCKHCRDRGFKGRVGIFELIPLEKEMLSLIGKETSEPDLQAKSTELGFNSLLADGIIKIKAGTTTAEEVLRVCHGN